MTKSWRLIGATATIMIALGGCTGTEEPRVASAGVTASPSPGRSADVVTTYVEAVRGYVKCLRAEGVEISDPDAKGHFEIAETAGMKSDPKYLAAQEKCGDLLPPVPEGLEEKPKLTAEEIEAAGKYAKCMRDNGATDFPDPGPDGYFPTDPNGDPVWDQTSEKAIKAGVTCGPIVGAPASPGPGQG